MTVSQIMEKLMELCDDCNCMTEWEMNFIDDMEKKRINNKPFTQEHLDKIEEIYKDRME